MIKGALQQARCASSPDFAGEGAGSATPHYLYPPLVMPHEAEPRVIGHQEVGGVGWNEDQAVDWTGDTRRPGTEALSSLAEWLRERWAHAHVYSHNILLCMDTHTYLCIPQRDSAT